MLTPLEELEAAVSAHLERCAESLEGGVDSPSLAPYCGCSTCDMRETLYATAKFLGEHREVIPLFLAAAT